MQVVVVVDAAPGFEDAVSASLKALPEVKGFARIKHGNYDMAVLIDIEDEAMVQRFMHGQMRVVTGVRAVERLEHPNEDLLARLTP